MLTLRRGCALALLLFAVSWVLATPAAASVDSVIQGTVQDALLHPLPGATVVLHDASGKTVASTTTGADGTFKFPGVPFGDYTVEASSPGLVEDHQHVQIASSEVKTLELTLVSESEVIEMSEDWAVPEPSKATGSVSTVDRQQLDELPGADDRPVTQVIATQPGFVADALGSVYARGTHSSIQYQVDGIPVPDSVGSLFAASIPVRLIEGLELYTGGMPAEYGRRLGAVVNLLTRRAGEQPSGSATVRYGSYNTVEPGVAYTTKVGPIGVFVGGSYQYNQRALDPPSRDVVFHDTGQSARVFTRLDWQPCDCNRHELFATYAHNKFQIPLDPTIPVYDPAVPRPTDEYGNDAPAHIPLDTRATETEDELFVAYSFTHKFDEDSNIQLAPLYKLSRGRLFGDATHALGPTADPGATASDVDRTAHHGGAIASYTRHTGRHLIKTGIEVDALYGKTDYTAYDDTGATRGTDRTKAITTGAYLQDRWTAGKVVADLGFRFDQLHVMLEGGDTDDSFGASPRAGVSYAFTKDTVAHAFAGVLWQPPAPLDAANAARALGVVPADDPVVYDLKPETDVFSELGVIAKLSSHFRGGLTGWGRYAWNQLDNTSIGSTSLVSSYNFKRGRAFGIEGTVEARVGPWLSLFANGAYGMAQGQGINSAKYLFEPEDVASTEWQTLDHAQTVTANAGGTVRDGRFTATALATYGSGLRTGPSNTDHVPGHVKVDVSTSYTFAPHAYPIKLGIDVLNVFDARYAYRIANGFVGSSYAAPRTVFLTLSVPLAAEPHHKGE
jgi:outer membrane cobalamin receptor